jgi:predicted  nucleic acid-binding Zn-ribbon protein
MLWGLPLQGGKLEAQLASALREGERLQQRIADLEQQKAAAVEQQLQLTQEAHALSTQLEDARSAAAEVSLWLVAGLASAH